MSLTRALSIAVFVSLTFGCKGSPVAGEAPAGGAPGVLPGPPPPGGLGGGGLARPAATANAPTAPAFTAFGPLPQALPPMGTVPPPVPAGDGVGDAGALREVPFLRQVGPGCIPYSAAAVAQFHGARVDPLDLLRSVPVTKFGVAYADVAAELVRRGLRAEVVHPTIPELRRLLADGFPVVVGQTYSVESDHAVVAIRHDRARATYAVMDPSQPAVHELPANALEAAYEGTGRQALLIKPARR